MKKLFALVLLLVLSQPYIVLAAPLAGANSDTGLYYLCDFGGCTEDTTDANDAGADSDVAWVFVGSDHAYIGDTTTQFDKAVFDIQTASEAAVGYDLVVEYYNGTMWTTLTTVPGAENPFQFTGVQSFSFTPPGDWATSPPEENSELTAAYFIRIADGSQGASINQISINTVGGGAGVPEFSTILYITTLSISAMYIYWRVQANQKVQA